MISEHPLTTGLLTVTEFKRLRENTAQTWFALFDPFEDRPAFVTRQFAPVMELSTHPLSSRSLKTKFLQGTCAIALAGLAAYPLYSTTQPTNISQTTWRAPAGLLAGVRATAFTPVDRANQPTGEISPAHNEEGVVMGRALSLIDLANEVLADSRPMTDWERKVTSDFIWSQFS